MQVAQLSIPRAPFARLVKEIACGRMADVRFQSAAIMALHEATEAFAVREFEAANVFTLHAGRVTIKRADLGAVGRIKAILGGC